MLSKGAFKALRKTIDYTEYGGAPLLGVRGVCVIAHGRSNGQRREERHPCGGGTRPRAHEREDRTGAVGRRRYCVTAQEKD